jgi:hypothetical protein
MQKHTRIICTILTIMGSIYLLLAVFVGIIGLMATQSQGETNNVALLPAMLTGVTFLIPLILFGVLHILTGKAFRAGKGWARVALWILAILNLGNVPIGTGLGIYAIWILMKTRESLAT